MDKLPHWSITDKHPAFYDTESATAIEMVAKLYAAMNQLIDEVNPILDNASKLHEEFREEVRSEFTAFTIGLRQEFQDFIDIINLKVMSQDKIINDWIGVIEKEASRIVSEKIESGVFVRFKYTDIDEGLYIIGSSEDATEHDVIYTAATEHLEIV